jgi:NADH-ubiquinone oxidoreductase chain 4L
VTEFFLANKLITIFILRRSLFTFCFVSGRKHLLATLLSLEGLILIIFCYIAYVVSVYWGTQSYLLLFLCLVACEGALGLSLLVVRIRTWGNDQISSVNVLQC